MNGQPKTTEIISFIYNPVNCIWGSKLDIAIGIYFYPLVIESVLLLLFLLILATRGIQRGANLLLIISIAIMLFAIPTIFEAIRLSAIPIPPPPQVWEEGYYDALAMRSFVSMKAVIDSLVLLVLSISYTYAKSRE
ncbi:MAG: hypothetical protein EAX95_11905 [Candidatus Thorarchaeota archaeon]|nr:hypothetical protein [Candidatus Thorarchaeota archaeon]